MEIRSVFPKIKCANGHFVSFTFHFIQLLPHIRYIGS